VTGLLISFVVFYVLFYVHLLIGACLF